MEQPLPIGMRFGAEIECFIKMPDGLTLSVMRGELKAKYSGDSVEFITDDSKTVAYWLLAKYEEWAKDKHVYSVMLNPGDFWLKSQGNSAAKAQVQTDYGKRINCWGVELDGSLNSTIQSLYKYEVFPFEFVSSPIAVDFSVQGDPFIPASDALSSFFEFFAFHKILVYSRNSSSMHIHLTPMFQDGSSAWTFDTIMSLGMCSAWFEPALRYVLPKNRRSNLFCIEYYNNVDWLKDRHSLRWSTPGTGTGLPIMEDLVTHMSSAFPTLQRRSKGKSVEEVCRMLQAGGDKSDGDDRYAAWNFFNMYKNKRGIQFAPIKTVEFRQPPGSSSAAEALDWVKYAVIFAMQACKYGTSELLNLVVAEYPNNPTKPNGEKLKQLYDCSDQGLQDFLSRHHPDRPAEELTKRCKFTVVTLILRQDEFRFVLDIEKGVAQSQSQQLGPLSGLKAGDLKKVLIAYEEQQAKNAREIEELKKKWMDEQLAAEDAAAIESIKKNWFGADPN